MSARNRASFPPRLSAAAFGLVAAFIVAPAIAQGPPVTDCAKTPHNADCHGGPTAGHLNHDATANQPSHPAMPAHGATATVPGKTPIQPVPPAAEGPAPRPWLKQGG